MTKAILVIDMPNTCEECMLCDTHEIVENDYDYINCYALHQYFKAYFDDKGFFTVKKPSNCPLKEIPKKKDDTQTKFMDSTEYARGFNDCIDEILGDSE